MTTMHNTKQSALRRLLLKQLTIFFLNGMFFMGIALIIYGIASKIASDQWHILEVTADFLSKALTIIGCILVCLSAYFPPHARPPDAHSKYVVSPVVIAICITTATFWAFRGTAIPAHIFNGLSIVGLALSVLRALPFSEWDDPAPPV